MYIVKKCFLVLIFLLMISNPPATSIAVAGVSDSAVQNLTIEKNKNSSVTVSYTITQPVYLILRVHSLSPNFPLIKQILPRALRTPGDYKEIWDGRDESGHYVQEKWQISARTESVELSPEAAQELTAFQAVLPNSNARPLSHYLHDANKCGVFNINFTNISDGSSIQGIFNATLKAEGFYGYTKDIGVNLKIFIDSQMVHELSLPFDQINELTFDVPLDASSLYPGKHILKAIIFDYADHYGIVSVEFIKP